MNVTAVSRTALFAGRALQVLIVLFLLLDAVAHVFVPVPVMDALARIGFPLHLSIAIGVCGGSHHE
jgi:hypothetical protein